MTTPPVSLESLADNPIPPGLPPVAEEQHSPNLGTDERDITVVTVPALEEGRKGRREEGRTGGREEGRKRAKKLSISQAGIYTN